MQVVAISNDELPRTPRRVRTSKSPQKSQGTDLLKSQLQDLKVQLENAQIALDEKQKELDEKVQLYNSRFKQQQTEIQQLTLLSDQRELDCQNLESAKSELQKQVNELELSADKLRGDINQQQQDFNVLAEQQKQKYDEELQAAKAKCDELQEQLSQQERANDELMQKAKKYKQQFQQKHKQFQQFSQKMKQRFNEREVELIEVQAELKQQLIDKQYELTQKTLEPPNSAELMQLRLENQSIKLKLDQVQQQYKQQLDRMRDTQKVSYFRLDESHSNLRREQASKILELEQVNQQLQKSIDQLEATYSEKLTVVRSELKESKQALVEHNQQFLESQRMLQSETVLMTERLAESQVAETRSQIGSFKEREKTFRAQIVALRRQVTTMQEENEKLASEAKLMRIEADNIAAQCKHEVAEQRSQLGQEYLARLNEARNEVVRLRTELQSSRDQHDVLMADSQNKMQQLLARQHNDLEAQQQQFQVQLKQQDLVFQQSFSRLQAEGEDLKKQLQKARMDIIALQQRDASQQAIDTQQKSALTDALNQQITDLKNQLRISSERYENELKAQQEREKQKTQELLKHNNDLAAELRKQQLSYEQQTQELRILFKAKELNQQRFCEEEKTRTREKLENEIKKKETALDNAKLALEQSKQSYTDAQAAWKRESTELQHAGELEKLKLQQSAQQIQIALEHAEQSCQQLQTRVKESEAALKQALEKQVAQQQAIAIDQQQSNESSAVLSERVTELQTRIAQQRAEFELQLIQQRECAAKAAETAQITLLNAQTEISKLKIEIQHQKEVSEEAYQRLQLQMQEQDAKHAQELQKTLQEHQQLMDDAEQRVLKLRADISAGQSALTGEYEDKIAQMKAELRKLTHCADDLRKQLDSQQAEHEAANLAEKQLANEQRKEIEHQREQELKREQEIKQQHLSQLAAKDAEMAALKKQFQDEKNATELADQQRKFSLQMERERYENRIKELQVKMEDMLSSKQAEADDELSRQRTQLERRLREQEADFSGQLAEKERLLTVTRRESEKIQLQIEQTVEMASAAKEDAKKQSQYYLSLLAQRRKELQHKDEEIAGLQKQRLDEAAKLRLQISDCAGTNAVAVAQQLSELSAAYNEQLEEKAAEIAELRQQLLIIEEQSNQNVEKVAEDLKHRINDILQQKQAAVERLQTKLDNAEHEREYFKGISNQLQAQLDALIENQQRTINAKQQELLQIIENVQTATDHPTADSTIKQLTLQFERRANDLQVEYENSRAQLVHEADAARNNYEQRMALLVDQLSESHQQLLACQAERDSQVAELESQIASLSQTRDTLMSELARQREDAQAYYQRQAEALKRQAAQFHEAALGSSVPDKVSDDSKRQLSVLASQLLQKQTEVQQLREQVSESASAINTANKQHREQLQRLIDERDRRESELEQQIASMQTRIFDSEQLAAKLREKYAQAVADSTAAQEKLTAERTQAFKMAATHGTQQQEAFMQRYQQQYEKVALEKIELQEQISRLEAAIRNAEANIECLNHKLEEQRCDHNQAQRESERNAEQAVDEVTAAYELKLQRIKEDYALQLQLKDEDILRQQEQHENAFKHSEEAHRLQLDLLQQQISEHLAQLNSRQTQQLGDSAVQIAQYVQQAEADGVRIANLNLQIQQHETDSLRKLAEKQQLINKLTERLTQKGQGSKQPAQLSVQHELSLQNCATELRLLRSRIISLKGQLQLEFPSAQLLAEIVRTAVVGRPSVSSTEQAYYESRLTVAHEMARSTISTYISEVAFSTGNLKHASEELAIGQRQLESDFSRLQARTVEIQSALESIRADSARQDTNVLGYVTELDRLLGGRGQHQIESIQQNWINRTVHLEDELTASRRGLQQEIIDALQAETVARPLEPAKTPDHQSNTQTFLSPVTNDMVKFVERLTACDIQQADRQLEATQEDCERTLNALSSGFEAILTEVFDHFAHIK